MTTEMPILERFDFDTSMGCVDKWADGAWVRYEDVQAMIESGELLTKAEHERIVEEEKLEAFADGRLREAEDTSALI